MPLTTVTATEATNNNKEKIRAYFLWPIKSIFVLVLKNSIIIPDKLNAD
jgi:hypothetical protein